MGIDRFVLVGLLALFAGDATSTRVQPATEPSGFRIAGYLPDYRAAEFERVAAAGLTDLIVFSAEPSESGGLDMSRLRNMPWAKLRAFKTLERVRLILCVGGWGRSAHFPTVCNSDLKRQEFVRSAVRICLDERLDGVDLDWEHPKNEAEQEGYANLLAELRRAFESQGLVLSVTLAAWQRVPRRAFDSVHWVNVMAYDHPGRHSTFEAAQSDVEKLRASGAPERKITLGLPFYGRDTAQPERTLTYREIVAKHRPGPEVDEVGSVYFNGPATIKRKTKFAVEARLGGVMIWELGQDALDDQSLLNVVRSVTDALPPFLAR